MEEIIIFIIIYIIFFLIYLSTIKKINSIILFIFFLVFTNYIFKHSQHIDFFLLNFLNLNFLFNIFCFSRLFYEKSPTLLLFSYITKGKNFKSNFIDNKLIKKKINLLKKQNLIYEKKILK